METIQSLVEDAASCFLSESLLAQSPSYESKLFRLAKEWKSITLQVCSHNTYLSDIALSNESSRCKALNDRLLARIQEFRVLVQQYEIESTFDQFRETHSAIEGHVRESLHVRELIDELVTASSGSVLERDDIIDNVIGGITAFAHHIIDARILLAGRRFGLTEAAFVAFNDGLFPFGYDFSTKELLCIGRSKRPE